MSPDGGSTSRSGSACSRLDCSSSGAGGRLASTAASLAACFPSDFDANTRLVMLFAIAANSIRNVWDQNIMSSFIYLLSDRSSYVVGFLTGTTGLVQALMAPVMGFFADKYPRVAVLRTSGVIGIVGILLTLPSVLYGHLVFIFLSMAVWGLFWASVNPTLDAVLADSARQGQRSRVYSWRYVMLILGTAVGPFVTLLIFSSLGDHWSVPECQAVISAGLCLFLAPVCLLFLFQPLHAQDGRSAYAALPVTSADDSASSATPSASATDAEQEDNGTALDVSIHGASLVSADGDPEKDVKYLEAGASRGVDADAALDAEAVRSRYLSFVVPATIAFGDIITGLASGMTIKFFPIYFMNDLSMKPVALSLLYTITPLCTAASGIAAQRFSLRYGRGTATVVFKLVGLTFMALLCYLAYHKYEAKYIIPVYIIRTALMNSSKPLTKSIIMDLVPADQRVRWAALESINNATWSGSAVLGGILIDKYGIISNFIATWVLQLISTLPLVLVASAIPAEKPSIIPTSTGITGTAAIAVSRYEAEEARDEEDGGSQSGRGDVELARRAPAASPSPPGSREREVIGSSSTSNSTSDNTYEWQHYDDGLEDDLELLHAAAEAMGADDDEQSAAVDLHLIKNRSIKSDVFWEDGSR